MVVKSWGFADGHGNSIARGWQNTEQAAREKAQAMANQRGMAVSFWAEPGGTNGEGEDSSETVEPRKQPAHVTTHDRAISAAKEMRAASDRGDVVMADQHMRTVNTLLHAQRSSEWPSVVRIAGGLAINANIGPTGTVEPGDMRCARAWARVANAGDYLVEYEDDGFDDVSDSGSRCGFGDDELAELGRILAKRDLRIVADDRGLVAETQPNWSRS